MIINTMTVRVASRQWRTSAPMLPSAGHRSAQVPQFGIGTHLGSMCPPAAGIQANPNSIRNRVVDAAKPGSPPRGAPR